jgi:hypothetical protein
VKYVFVKTMVSENPKQYRNINMNSLNTKNLNPNYKIYNKIETKSYYKL